MHILNYLRGYELPFIRVILLLLQIIKSHQCLNRVPYGLKSAIGSRESGIKYVLSEYIQIKYYLKSFFKNKSQQSENGFYSSRVFVFFDAR